MEKQPCHHSDHSNKQNNDRNAINQVKALVSMK